MLECIFCKKESSKKQWTQINPWIRHWLYCWGIIPKVSLKKSANQQKCYSLTFFKKEYKTRFMKEPGSGPKRVRKTFSKDFNNFICNMFQKYY